MEEQANQQSQPQRVAHKKKPIMMVLLIVFVVAIAAALGLGWYRQTQNYQESINLRDQQIADLEKTVASLQEKTAAATTDDTASKSQNLVIQEWDVQVPLTADIYDSFYVINNESTFAKLSTESVAKLDATCDPRENGDAQAGIGRSEPTAIVMADMPVKEAYPNGKEIGGYYYYFVHPQSLCAKDQILETKITAAFKDAISAIQSAE